jgi:hypothetical protein
MTSPREATSSPRTAVTRLLCLASLGCALPADAEPRAAAPVDCKVVQTPDQKRDEDTIRRIERAWLTAEMRGNVRFLQCLLTPDYVNIRKDGSKHPGADVLAMTAKNAGSEREVPPIESTVVVRGDAALSYSSSKTRTKDGQWQDIHFIDSFVFVDGAWRAYAGVDL